MVPASVSQVYFRQGYRIYISQTVSCAVPNEVNPLASASSSTVPNMTNGASKRIPVADGGVSKTPSCGQRTVAERVVRLESTLTLTANAYSGIRKDLESQHNLSGLRYRQLYDETERLHRRIDRAFEHLGRLEQDLRVCTILEDWARSTELGYCCPAVRRLRHAINDVLPHALAQINVNDGGDVDMPGNAGN